MLAGERVLTSGVEVGPGWVLGVLALSLTVLAGCCAAVAWGRTVMDDDGPLDAVRSGLAGAAVLLGVATVLCLALPAADVPDQLVTDAATGLQTVVTREGPQALLERPGLALLGGLLLAGAVVLCSVIALAAARPRRGRRPAGHHRRGPRRGAAGCATPWVRRSRLDGAGRRPGGHRAGLRRADRLAWRLRRGDRPARRPGPATPAHLS